MKKYFLSIVALAGMLFATSCQESLVEPQMEGPTTFTVQVPDAMGTKAIGEASSVNKLFVDVYSNGNSIFKKSQEITNGSTTVSLDLIKGQEYQIVFWAQKDNSYVKEGDALAEISIPTDFHNNESGAAFYAYETFEIDGNAKTVTLRRPFAQLNLGTTALSLDTDASSSDVQLLSSSVTLATATKFSTIFGAGINVDTRTYTASISSFGDEKLTLANGSEYVYVSMDYLPVVYGGDVVELGVKIETNLGTITHNFTNVPIQKNYRTNIVGNLISSTTDFVVEVNDDWAGTYDRKIVEVSSANELETAINKSEVVEVVLANDIELSKILEITSTNTKASTESDAQLRNLILDGKGHTLKSTAGRAINVSGVEGVTIKNLNINCTGERAINIIQNATNVTIDNVTATAANYTVNVAGSAPKAIVNITNSTLNGLCTVNVSGVEAEVYVNNSTVNCNDNNTTDGESYAALCLNKDAVKGKIIATNTIVNVTEGSDSMMGRNGAEDGVVTINGSTDDVAVMVAVITYPGSDYYYSFASLNEAFKFAQKENRPVTLIRNITVEEPIVIEEGQTVVLDLNGKTINVDFVEGSTTNHIYAFTNYANLTIKGNGTINARGIFNYGVLTLENGTINAIDGNGGYAVRNYRGAEFIMNGGTLATTFEDDNQVDKGGYDATTLRVDEGATATINGGEISNICDFTVAIENHGETTIIGGSITSVHSTVANYATMTINGGRFRCNGLEGVTAQVLWVPGGQVKINGGTFDGKDNYNGFNVTAEAGSKVIIEGGEFLPVHSGSLYGEGTIKVSGGTFFDEPSEKRLAEGYDAVYDNDNKVWTVVSKAN